MANRRPIRPRDIRDPSRILANLQRDYLEGALDDNLVLIRVLVIETDFVGGNLENNPPNPPNSFKGRIITRAIDRYTEPEDLPIFWPMFSHDVMPIKAGEHVYAIFEDEDRLHGVWLSRIPEPKRFDNVNYAPGYEKFKEDEDNDLNDVGRDQAVQDSSVKPDSLSSKSQSEIEKLKEDVPSFESRLGDRIVHGSNNTTIVLGRDRPSDPDSGESKGAGTIDIVTGRTEPLNPSMEKDKSRIYVTSNSDVDANFNIQSGDPAGPSASVVVKSDEVRIVARNGMKIVVGDGEPFSIVVGSDGKVTVKSDKATVIESPDINLGGDNLTEPIILGNAFMAQFQALLTALSADALGAATFLGVAGVQLPAVIAAIPNIQSALELTKSKVVKTK